MKQQVIFFIFLLMVIFAKADSGYQVLVAEKGTEFRRVGDEILIIKQIQTDTVYCQDDIKKMCQMRTSFNQLVRRVGVRQGIAPEPMIKEAIISKLDVLVRQTRIENHRVGISSVMGLKETYPLHQTYVFYDSDKQIVELKDRVCRTDSDWSFVPCAVVIYLSIIFLFWLSAAYDFWFFWKELKNATLMATAFGTCGIILVFGLYAMIIFRGWTDTAAQVFAALVGSGVLLIVLLMLLSTDSNTIKAPAFIANLPRIGKQRLLLGFLAISIVGAIGIFAIQSSWVYGAFWVSLFVGIWTLIRLFFYAKEKLENRRLKMSY